MSNKFFLDLRDPNLFEEKFPPLLKAMQDEDDLPCALMCAAYVDKCLIGLLKTVIVNSGETEKGQLKGETGLINSLHARAAFAYMLGLITKPMLEQITTICRIRNLFAHSAEPLTFDSEDVASLCKNLPDHSTGFLTLMSKGRAPTFRLSPSSSRNRYVESAFGMAFVVAITPRLKELNARDKESPSNQE